MPGFDIGHSVNSASEWITTAPLIRKFVGNPIYMSLLITAIVIIALVSMSKTIKASADAKPNYLRYSVYIFMTVTALLFIHHYATVKFCKLEAKNDDVRSVITSVEALRNLNGVTSTFGGSQTENQTADIEQAEIQDVSIPLVINKK